VEGRGHKLPGQSSVQGALLQTAKDLLPESLERQQKRGIIHPEGPFHVPPKLGDRLLPMEKHPFKGT
jgi:hypothetical protein